jgi:uncharacterized protein
MMGQMREDALDYAQLVREALLDVPRRALRRAARSGLPGEHHFYLSFRTDHPGVAIGPALKARHPGEMTIVLQHQYWDLAVGDDAFSVTLRFGGAPERVHVPFAALTAFVDPAVQFGLRFDGPESGVKAPPEAETARGTNGPAPSGEEVAAGNVVDISSFRRGSGDR